MGGTRSVTHSSSNSGSGYKGAKWSSKRHAQGVPLQRPLLLPFIYSPKAVLTYSLLLASLALNVLWLAGRGAWVPRILLGTSFSALGRQTTSSCGRVDLPDLHQHLHNIVLVVNLRTPAVATRPVTDFFLAVYQRLFDTVVFLGPVQNEELNIHSRSAMPWATNGSYSYFYFPKLVTKHPTTEGYLWMDDSVVLNYWHLRNANTSMLWLPHSPACETCQLQGAGVHPRDADVSVASSSPACGSFSVPSELFRYAWPHLSVDEEAVIGLRRLRAVSPNIFFVPRRHAMTLAFDILPVFRDHGVPQEVAIPMMFALLEPGRLFDPVLDTIVCVRDDPETEMTKSPGWHGDAAGFHPWDVQESEGRHNLLTVLQEYDSCLMEVGILENP